MSRTKPTLAEALKVPAFTLRLEPAFVERMAALEAVVAEHGKAEGLKAWANAEIQAHMTSPAVKAAGQLYEELGTKWYLGATGDRAKLADAKRRLGRWWLAQGVSIEQARSFTASPTNCESKGPRHAA